MTLKNKHTEAQCTHTNTLTHSRNVVNIEIPHTNILYADMGIMYFGYLNVICEY